MQFENLEATYLEYILDISPNVNFEVHGNLCNKDPPSRTYLVSTGKASIPHSPDVQIASARCFCSLLVAFPNYQTKKKDDLTVQI